MNQYSPLYNFAVVIIVSETFCNHSCKYLGLWHVLILVGKEVADAPWIKHKYI